MDIKLISLPKYLPYRREGNTCQCGKPYYAKGMCRDHYHHLLIFMRSPLWMCESPGCTRMVRKELKYCYKCRTRNEHRVKRGLPLDTENLTKGKFNVNWKGGVSQYPNHSELKRARLRVLKAANYTCACGGFANYAIHKDKDKANHKDENLLPVCKDCFYSNIEGRGRKRLLPGETGAKLKTSKFLKIYRMTMRDLSHLLGVSYPTISSWHKKGKLWQKLSEKSFKDGGGI